MNKVTKISLLSGSAVIALAVAAYFVFDKKEKVDTPHSAFQPRSPNAPQAPVSLQNKATTSKAKYPFQGIVNTKSSALNMRKQPSTQAAIMTKLPKGKLIQVLAQKGQWYETNLGGWVHADYIKFVKQL